MNSSVFGSGTCNASSSAYNANLIMTFFEQTQHDSFHFLCSRKQFTEEQAEKWWGENGGKVCERHNILVS